MSRRFAVIDTEYWGNRLEVGTELILEQHADDRYMEAWVAGLSPRCRSILVERFGLATDQSIADTRSTILEHRDQLLPFLLVDAATQKKRMHAIVDVARNKLPEEILDQGRIKADKGDERFDRNALMWLLFEHDPANLELVFLVDRTERRGFARMVLRGRRARQVRDAVVFFERDRLQRILDEYEQKERTLRQSHCSAVMREEGTVKVFIKRDHRPGFVSHGATNTFGFEREWIVLDFDEDLRRVRICSLSPDAPLQLANRIASAYFDQKVHYDNEYIVTDGNAIVEFLGSLRREPERLPLVELVVRNSSLPGSPQLRFNARGNRSLAPALRQYSAVFGDPFERLADIESVKVFAFEKRVRLVFEPAGPNQTQYIVRYADQPLNGSDRRGFEQLMSREYGIAVLSTEKKNAR